ncbi:MAG: YitT family protein [Clostridium sp.]|uniref:YitT family protein n=1 Tax=Clostridium sp. TaxID=1506 RepID=UPI0025BB0DE2|nr:YitT family protein [Clostridium sp.]MCF0148441.1 YitT family protein [Clostridium sp.]
MTNGKVLDVMKEYTMITLGVILVAVGLQYFYSPNDLAAGGLSGMSLIINNFIPVLSVGVTIFVGNLILYVIAFFIIGGDFGFKTIYGSVMLSVVIEVLDRVFKARALTNNLLSSVLIGAILISLGLGIAFYYNASTGGTDILAKILNKYSTFNIGISLLFVDIIVTICGGIVFGLEKGIYSLLAVFITGVLIDKFILILTNYKNKKEKISEAVLN